MSRIVLVARATLTLALVITLGCASTNGPEAKAAAKQAEARYDLGVENMTQGQTALALRNFLAAEQLAPKDGRIQIALAEAYRQSGRLADAEQHLRRALEIDPNDQAAGLNLSALLIQEGKFEEAASLAGKLADDPTFPAPWRALTNAGWAEIQLGRFDEARQHLNAAVEFKPNYWSALLDLGILEERQGHAEKALVAFQKLLDLGPTPSMAAEAHFRMGEIYVSLGERDQAVEHLTAAAEHRPGSAWGQRSEEVLKLLQ
jgi:type IV pilus biogenesis/stability protein PilW